MVCVCVSNLIANHILSMIYDFLLLFLNGHRSLHAAKKDRGEKSYNCPSRFMISLSLARSHGL